MPRIPLLIAALWIAGCSPSSDNASVPGAVDLEAESAAILEAWQGANEALLAGDWDRYSEFFVDAARFRMIHPIENEWLAGSDEFEEVYRTRIRGLGEWEIRTNRFDISISPRGGVAWTTAEVRLGTPAQSQTAWQLAVWEKLGGRWRISAAMSSTLSSNSGR